MSAAAPRCVVERCHTPPDLLALHAADPQRYPFLLQSVVHGTPRARYDILFAFPGTTLALAADGVLRLDERALAHRDFLAELDRQWASHGAAAPDTRAGEQLPFCGGWFLFLAYELLGTIEPSVVGLCHEASLPVALAVRMPAAIVHDHVRQQAYRVCEASQAHAYLPELRRDAAAATAVGDAPLQVTRLTEDEPQAFLAGVARVRDYIRAGDVFQVNLSRAWQAELAQPLAPHALYRRLRAANPAPFAGLMVLPGARAVISSSPERLVELRAGRVSTRPIAGTYPRSLDPAEDAVWSRELLAHPKERAEHVMLIDLERNDLGRVCRSGSVQVHELMVLESYRHVHHIVSEICGTLRPGMTPGAVIRAVFPGGTITGCPKVRCMQIIAELERAPRGAYTGSMGYLNHDGSMDLNILIRTIVQDGLQVHLRAGAGIVADSLPERELAETRAKARGLLAALGPM